jgi:hypothetical protein
MSVCLVDTSILCELLEVPNLCSQIEAVSSEMHRKIAHGERLLLPMSTILETGNHIGQNGTGQQRWQAARRFALLIEQAIRGETPFTPTPFFEAEDILGWLHEFPDWAKRGDARGRGCGLVDLTIVMVRPSGVLPAFLVTSRKTFEPTPS